MIRREKPEDIPAIRYVNERAFGRPPEADLVDALRAHGKIVFSLVAERENRIVGHILFSPVAIESGRKGCNVVGLAPLAVLPEFQGQGIGCLLVKSGFEQCRQSGYDGVVVLGHPTYYPRFGFVPASKYGINCEYVVADGVFMAVELRAGALGDCTGRAKYEPEFAKA